MTPEQSSILVTEPIHARGVESLTVAEDVLRVLQGESPLHPDVP